MRLCAWLTAGLAVSLAGCGYVGPVLPPSPELPQAVVNLVARERGEQLVITFSTPNQTTDNLAVVQLSHLDLRIGTYAPPFDFGRWAGGATAYELTPPAATERDNPLPSQVTKTLAAKDWVGKRVAIAVRTSMKKNDHYSAWSNRVVVDVAPPLAPPVVRVKSTAQGVAVTWNAVEGAAEYQVFRQAKGDNAPSLVGTSKSAEYVDTSSQYETPYTYTVVATQGSAESLASLTAPITTSDTYAPSVPTGLTALAAPNSIEVSWQRSPESDLKGYLLYRSVNGGPPVQVGDLLSVPTFSDRAVEHGKTYRYAVSATDQKGNTSEKSGPADVVY